jgi:type II secretory ATPase GspE/PulE/Tfp pilus assembly ATPase PilB-like protein
VKEAGEDEIEAAAQPEGIIRMLDDGMRKVAEGITTEAEVLRAVKLG